MNYTKKTKTGFSLIELLIVISIVGFLASIVVASLADAREGARNSKRNETARQYVSALALHHSEYGTFPDPIDARDSWSCLGDGYPDNTCRVYEDGDEMTEDSDSDLSTALAEFIDNPASLDSFNYDGDVYYGIVYRCTSSTACNGYDMSWILEGSGNDAQCFGGASSVDVGGVFKHCTFSAGSTE